MSSGKAILHCKCPRCRQGDMFRNSLQKKWFSRSMHKKCPVCDQTFEPEPGFFFGAMYISYAFSVALTTVSSVLIYFIFDDPPVWVYAAAMTGLVLLLWPLMYRYSRSIFLHVFGGIRFNAKYQDSK